jgi:hypothetical protein
MWRPRAATAQTAAIPLRGIRCPSRTWSGPLGTKAGLERRDPQHRTACPPAEQLTVSAAAWGLAMAPVGFDALSGDTSWLA